VACAGRNPGAAVPICVARKPIACAALKIQRAEKSAQGSRRLSCSNLQRKSADNRTSISATQLEFYGLGVAWERM
jgi:hypothetical protein